MVTAVGIKVNQTFDKSWTSPSFLIWSVAMSIPARPSFFNRSLSVPTPHFFNNHPTILGSSLLFFNQAFNNFGSIPSYFSRPLIMSVPVTRFLNCSLYKVDCTPGRPVLPAVLSRCAALQSCPCCIVSAVLSLLSCNLKSCPGCCPVQSVIY